MIDPQGIYHAQLDDLEPGGTLQIDDVVVKKLNNSATDFVFPVYSGSDQRVLDGHDYVALHYVAPSGAKRLLALLLWRNEGQTKIKMAQEAVEQMLARGFAPAYVAFDHGYLEPDFCRWLGQKKLLWTSRVQSTQLFYFGNEWLACRQWAKKLPKETWHFYQKAGVYAKGIEASNRDFLRVKIVVVKWERSGTLKSYVYLITNDRTASVMDVIRRHQDRWPVEVCFRDCKQSLGLSSYRFTEVEKIEGHSALVLVAYNFMQWIGEGSDLPVGQLKRMAQGKLAKPRRTRISATRLTKQAA
jgi:hypothetical protein